MFLFKDFSLEEFAQLRDLYGTIKLVEPSKFPGNQHATKKLLGASFRAKSFLVFYDIANSTVLAKGLYNNLFYAKSMGYDIKIAKENSIYIAVVTKCEDSLAKNKQKLNVDEVDAEQFVANIEQYFGVISKEDFLASIKPTGSNLLEVLQTELNLQGLDAQARNQLLQISTSKEVSVSFNGNHWKRIDEAEIIGFERTSEEAKRIILFPYSRMINKGDKVAFKCYIMTNTDKEKIRLLQQDINKEYQHIKSIKTVANQWTEIGFEFVSKLDNAKAFCLTSTSFPNTGEKVCFKSIEIKKI